MVQPRPLRRCSELWFVYLLRRDDGSLYCGCTNRLGHRLRQHAAGKGAKCMRGRSFVLAHLESVVGRSAALRREAVIKGMSKVQKEELCLLASPAESSPSGKGAGAPSASNGSNCGGNPTQRSKRG